MSSTQKIRARGLLTPKEFAIVDSIAFPPAAIQAAFLLGHEGCRAWHDRRSGALRSAKDQEELRSEIETTLRESPLFARMGAALLAQDSAAKMKALARESALKARSTALASEAMSQSRPAPMFDRRSGEWVAPGFWAALPFVDGPGGQDFTHAALS